MQTASRIPILALVSVLATTLLLSTVVQNVSAATPLKVTAKAAKDTITRGSTQTITVTVKDSAGKAVKDATVTVKVTYASKSTIKSVTGKTDKNGAYSFSWQIGGNSNPGTFTVEVKATKTGYDAGTAKITFTVNKKN